MSDSFQTASTLDTAGGSQDDTQSPTYELDADITYPDRDQMTDYARKEDASSMPARDVGHQADARVQTVQDEKDADGWDKLARPVGGSPDPLSTAGTRGGPHTPTNNLGSDR